jgi:hypothetical protein
MSPITPGEMKSDPSDYDQRWTFRRMIPRSPPVTLGTEQPILFERKRVCSQTSVDKAWYREGVTEEGFYGKPVW